MAAGTGGTTPLPRRRDRRREHERHGRKVVLVNGTTALDLQRRLDSCSTARSRSSTWSATAPARLLRGRRLRAWRLHATTTAALRKRRRLGNCQDTDTNSADFTLIAAAPRSNTASPLNSCSGADEAPSVVSVTPADGADTVAGANVAVSFSEPVTVSGRPGGTISA